MSVFTHPGVGQAEHLACRKRQPGAFAGVARTHFRKGAGSHRKPLSLPCGPCVPISGQEQTGAPLPVDFDDAEPPCGAAQLIILQRAKNTLKGPDLGPFGGVRF